MSAAVAVVYCSGNLLIRNIFDGAMIATGALLVANPEQFGCKRGQVGLPLTWMYGRPHAQRCL